MHASWSLIGLWVLLVFAALRPDLWAIRIFWRPQFRSGRNIVIFGHVIVLQTEKLAETVGRGAGVEMAHVCYCVS